MKNSPFLLSFVLGTILIFTACNPGKEPAAPKNILETAGDRSELSTFLTALELAGLTYTLDGTSSNVFTVFAPTNTAFATYLTANNYSKLEDIPLASLRQLLQYHLVIGDYKYGTLASRYVDSQATFGSTSHLLKLYLDNKSALLVNDAGVSSADLAATNGVLHIVDKVLPLPTVVDQLQNNAAFSDFRLALTRPDLGIDYVSTLSEAGPFTVFAPTNAAFTALLTELGLSNLNDIPVDLLNGILQYHVAPNANLRAQQLESTQELTTLGGKKFSITAGTKLTDNQGRQGNLVTLDIQATNGVVHSLDKVLRPN